jgi:ATPase subunit of ABC transporter with duplicated ATPase domains
LSGELIPQQGKIYIGTEHVRYLDQNLSLLNPELSIMENFLSLNPHSNEYDAYQGLAQFLFKNATALKLVKNLSGGEQLRALLACVLLSKTPPQLLILDEPTNHLDLSSIQNIESALKQYQGALLVISHDPAFLDNIGISSVIQNG